MKFFTTFLSFSAMVYSAAASSEGLRGTEDNVTPRGLQGGNGNSPVSACTDSGYSFSCPSFTADVMCMCDENDIAIFHTQQSQDTILAFIRNIDCVAINLSNDKTYAIPAKPNPVQLTINADGSFAVKSLSSGIIFVFPGAVGPAEIPTDTPSAILHNGLVEYEIGADFSQTFTKVNGPVVNLCEELA